MKELPLELASQIRSNVFRLRELFNHEVLSCDSQVLHQSCLIEIIILLRDLLAKADKLNLRIAFDDDVIKMSNPFYSYKGRVKEIKDVTDVVSFFRDAMCHVDSKNRYLGENIYFAFNKIGVKHKVEISPGVVLENPYDDEIAYYYGPQRIYINKHLKRAFKEVVEKFNKNYSLNL